MKNAEYWARRFAQLETAQHALGEDAIPKIGQFYREAQKDIETAILLWYQRFADNNEITLAEARQWLTGSDLDELHWDVKEYIRRGEENAVSGRWMKQLESASAKWHISRFEALKLRTQQSLELLTAKCNGQLTKTMSDVYRSGYYHTAFEIQKGTGIGFDIAGVDQKRVEAVLSKPWAPDGANFSDRLWANKQKLVDTLHKDLTQGIMLGKDPKKTIDTIAKTMNVSKSQAGRLVMTEEAYFSSASQKQAFADLGVEKYEIVATLDSRTSEICRELDGKVYDMKDYRPGETAPPFHVNCRTTTAPHFDDDFDIVGERAARDEEGKTYYVPADMTYREWEEHAVRKMAAGNGDTEWHGTRGRKITESEKQDIIEYAANYNIGIHNLKYFDGDISLLKSTLDTLANIKEEYSRWIPKKVTISFSNTMTDEEFGETRGRTITLNPRALRDREITEKNIKDDKFFASSKVEDIVVHEVGHLIASIRGEKGVELAQQAYYNVYKTKLSIDEIIKYLGNDISEYAAHYDGTEEDSKYRFSVRRYREIIPEVIVKDRTNGSAFTREFIRLLKEKT